jgi:tripartite-type tricarboxylate transporter receptor subunit TctC
MRNLLLSAALAAATISTAFTGHAQSIEEFYKGKTIQMMIGYGPGTGGDLYARVLSRHIGNHIPGKPSVLLQNMPGAGGLTAVNQLYNVAPKDGTVIGYGPRGLFINPLYGMEEARFEAVKFTWLGSMSKETSMCVTWHGSDIKTIEDAKKREVPVGSVGAGGSSYQFPILLNGLFGTRFKPLLGYPSSAAIFLAVERGELDGQCSFSWGTIKSAYPQWIEKKYLNYLLQLAVKKNPEIPDVPLVMDLAKDDETRQVLILMFADQEMGRPVAAPPGIPADRAEALRAAFAATMTDRAFLDDASKSGASIDSPISGREVESVITSIYASPKPVIEKVKAVTEIK